MDRRRLLRYGAALAPLALCVRIEATPMTLATIDQARARTAQLRRAGTVQAGLAPDFAAHARDTLGLLEVTRRRARLDALAAAADAHMGASDAAWADGLD